MGRQVPFAPYLGLFFCYCNHLFRETQTNKVDKTKTKQKQDVSIKQWRDFHLCFQSSMTSYDDILFMEKEKRKKQCETMTQKCMPS